ncbi:hypothetical protein [Kocuria arenosa]|uniref:hypothetical protein n=1 Tax=Kocuria arenosa TaxID=3071446 RepID=UPI0034D3F9D5
MHPRLSVLVQIDLDGRSVRLVVTGDVTLTNQKALPPLVARARTVLPEATITLDLSAGHLVEPLAVELLERHLTHPALTGPPVLISPPANSSPAATVSPTPLPVPRRVPASRHGPHESPRRAPTPGHAPARGLPATA